LGLEHQQQGKNTFENYDSRSIGHQTFNRALATKTTERLTMTLIDIGLYIQIILLVFHASKGRSLVTIKIGSFKR